jgi:methylphosphotriester-DNA--protein-cysteine methyltransferase
MAISAVRTTGIYCQPTSNAGPLPDNVVMYDNARR